MQPWQSFQLYSFRAASHQYENNQKKAKHTDAESESERCEKKNEQDESEENEWNEEKR